MLLLSLIFLRQSFQYGVMNPDSTFCICQNSPTTACQELCYNFKQLKFTQKSIKRSIELSKSSVITFLIFGTDEIQPDFNLSTFENRSFNIIAPNKNESIILYPGDANHGIYHKFVNIKIKLKAGFFSFYNFHLVHSEINPFSDKDQCEIGQDYLDLDYYSLNAISERIYLRPPTNGIRLFCQHYVNKIQFLNDQKIIFGNDSSNFIDFSQVERNGNSTVILASNDITFTFSQLPKKYDFFPKITFVLKRSSKIFIDEEQFPEEIMELQKYITFQHSDRTVYIQSRPGTSPPKFNLVGTGKELYNNKEIKFFASYCLCEGEDCIKNCGENEIVKFNEIDSTVVGNPMPSITYLIAGSSNLNMPTFDFEHFAKKNLTILGSSLQQHINITGDATDDFGFYKISGITIHSNDNFLFHNVTFSKVDFEVHRKSENFNDSPLFNSTCLNIDFSSLQNLWNKKIKLFPPIHGMGIHTTNIVNEDLILMIISSSIVSIQNINVSISNQSFLSIYCDRTINILTDNAISKKLSNFPCIKLYAEGDVNTVNFMGNWPKDLSDISAKLTVIHGKNPLYVQGDFDGVNYKIKSPIIDHIGIGPIFFNGVLSNYKDSYCVCQGDNCLDLCHGEVPINYTKQSISTTVINNPTRIIQYVIKNSNFQNYPIFDLDDFTYKSFIVQNGDKKGCIGILPHKLNIDSSITYTFKNIKIILLEDKEYHFGQLQLEKVSFFKYSRKYQNTIIRQFGMASDLYSIQSLLGNELLTPCSSYISINGNTLLDKIEIIKSNLIALCSTDSFLLSKQDSCININIGDIHETVPTISTLYGSTERFPLRFVLSTKPSEIPKIQIDVSHVENGNSYIQFEGSDFTNEYHILTNKITVIHGFNNIHIMTPYEDGMFIGQPPHVSLIGDADYYLNEVKQISLFVPENHTNIRNDDDGIAYKYSNYIILIAFFIFLIFIFEFVSYKRNNRNIDERIPALMMVQVRDKEDDQLSSFVDEEDRFTYS